MSASREVRKCRLLRRIPWPSPPGSCERQPIVEPQSVGIAQPVGIVERLVRDDTDRKRFLKMTGAAGAASFGAFVFAACGSSKSTTTSATGAAAATSSTGASTAAPSGGDVGILNYALTLEYLESEFYGKVIAAGLFTGKVGALIKDFAQPGAVTRGSAERRPSASSAEPLWPSPTASSRSKMQIRWPSWPTRSRTWAQPPTSDRPPTSRAPRCWPRRIGDPLRRGSPRGHAGHAREEAGHSQRGVC